MYLFTVLSLLVCYCCVSSTQPLGSAQERNQLMYNSCFKLECINPNQPCNTTTSFCLKNSTCQLSPSGGDTCIANTVLGTLDAACSSNSACYSGYCYNNKCNQGYSPGTPCKSDNQCIVQNADKSYTSSCVNKRCYGLSEGTTCTSAGQCNPPLTCLGVCSQPSQLGGMCNSNTDCAKGLVCNTTCINPLNEGEACDMQFSDLCGGNTVCTPTNQNGISFQCIQAYSQSVGSFCNLPIHCGEQMLCNFTGYNNGIGACQHVSLTSSLKTCSLSSTGDECAAYEGCQCDFNTGTSGKCVLEQYGNKIGSKQVYADFQSCLAKCDLSDTPCIYSSCSKQYCKYINIEYPAERTNKFEEKFYPSCYLNAYFTQFDLSVNGYFTCTAEGSITNSSIVLLLLVLLVACL